MDENYKKEIKEEFREALFDAFGFYNRFALFSGSFLYQSLDELRGKSDVDIIAVLDDSVLDDQDYLERRRFFNHTYVDIHRKYGLEPDTFFPGEIISSSMLEETKQGRGFKRDSNVLEYENMTGNDEEWINNPDLEYRCWRSMFFFTNDSGIIFGDYEDIIESRKKVIFPLLAYFYRNMNLEQEISYQDFLQQLISFFKSSEKSDFGYSYSYDKKLEDDLLRENIPIYECLKENGIVSKGVVMPGEFEKKIINVVSQINLLKTNKKPNPFIIEKWQ